MRAPNLTHEGWANFIAIWQTSRTLAEVCRRTGLKGGGVNSRVLVCRRHGVPLKRMAGRNRKAINWFELREVAMETETADELKVVSVGAGRTEQ
jgi:hypothetical protein